MIERWICKKCSDKWIYPIEKCPKCYGSIEKEIGRNLKVVGSTKVFVPSVSHPIVPYNIVILEDEHGAQMPKKTFRDYSIGDSFEWKKAATEHAVAIIKVKYDINEAVKQALELIDGVKVDEKTKILIKPNMMVSAYPYLAMTTNPKVIDALLSCLLEKGTKAENITVAEQCLFGKIEDALEKSGIGEIINKRNVKFVDISKTEFEEKTIEGIKLKVSKEVFMHDLIINVPVLKTDMLTVVSAALKNMISFVNIENIQQFLKEPSEKMTDVIIGLHKIIPKYITLSDGTIGMHGNGPLQFGEPAFLNIIMASRDPVANDKYFQEMGLLRKSPLVEMAAQKGIGEADMEKIENVGDELKACMRELKQPIGSALICQKS